ncbi:hypothetical protein AB4Z22_00515 [Paenibacillus sp. TAF58]
MFIIVKFENNEKLIEITMFFIISDEEFAPKLKNFHFKDVYPH